MESPPPTKKSKLEDSVKVETSEIGSISTDPGDTISQTSVRQQLHDMLSEISARSCGTPLPIEVTEQIIDHCLYSDFSELPADAFDDKEYELVDLIGEDVDMLNTPLHKHQLTAIIDLPDKPLEYYGSDIEAIINDCDLGVWWIHIGFPVGWKGSGELLEFDLWMCSVANHYDGVFVFEEGSTDVLLRYEPTVFCKPVRHPERAEELSNLCAKILFRALE